MCGGPRAALGGSLPASAVGCVAWNITAAFVSFALPLWTRANRGHLSPGGMITCTRLYAHARSFVCSELETQVQHSCGSQF